MPAAQGRPLRRSPRHLRMDPLDTVEANAAFAILACLSPKALGRCCAVNKAWKEAAMDQRLWDVHCQELWKDKMYVPKAILDLHPKQAYARSIDDSTRTAITPEELCNFNWTFRFRRVAGVYWYQHQKGRMLRTFHLNGSITAPSNDLLWQQHEAVANRWAMRRSQQGVRGVFVQINHWPSLELHRSADWGWAMRNQWVVYRARLQRGGVGRPAQQAQQEAGERQHTGALLAGAQALGQQDIAAAADEEASSSGSSESDGEYSVTSGSDAGSSSEELEDESSEDGGGGGESEGNASSDEDW